MGSMRWCRAAALVHTRTWHARPQRPVADAGGGGDPVGCMVWCSSAAKRIQRRFPPETGFMSVNMAWRQLGRCKHTQQQGRQKTAAGDAGGGEGRTVSMVSSAACRASSLRRVAVSRMSAASRAFTSHLYRSSSACTACSTMSRLCASSRIHIAAARSPCVDPSVPPHGTAAKGTGPPSTHTLSRASSASTVSGSRGGGSGRGCGVSRTRFAATTAPPGGAAAAAAAASPRPAGAGGKPLVGAPTTPENGTPPTEPETIRPWPPALPTACTEPVEPINDSILICGGCAVSMAANGSGVGGAAAAYAVSGAYIPGAECSRAGGAGGAIAAAPADAPPSSCGGGTLAAAAGGAALPSTAGSSCMCASSMLSAGPGLCLLGDGGAKHWSSTLVVVPNAAPDEPPSEIATDMLACDLAVGRSTLFAAERPAAPSSDAQGFTSGACGTWVELGLGTPGVHSPLHACPRPPRILQSGDTRNHISRCTRPAAPGSAHCATSAETHLRPPRTAD